MNDYSKTHQTISPQAIIEKWGGVRSGGGHYTLPHVCPGGSGTIKGSPLKINLYTGTIKCFSTNHNLDYFAVREILTGDPDTWIQGDDEAAERRRAAEDRQRREEAKRARYEDKPLPILTHVDAHLYLKEIATGWGKVEYRRSSDGLIAVHNRPSPGRWHADAPKAWTKGLHGSGWEPRIWEPEERIREYLAVVEGEKDAATACTQGLAAVSYPGGAGRCMDADWSGVIEYAETHGLEIIQGPDTGTAGKRATGKLARKFGWPVADLEGIPDGDCALDMTDWLERFDARKPWKTSREDKKQWDRRNRDRSCGDGPVFADDDDTPGSDGTPDENTPVVPRNNLASPESFPCEEWGWAYTEHAMHDGEKAMILRRCHVCAGCIETRRNERAWRYERWREHDEQTTVWIPGWKNIDALAHYRGLNVHKTRTPSGKRIPSILSEADYTHTLVFVYDGEMDEHQQKLAIRHARRYGMEATITVGPLTQGQFKGLVSDEASIESQDPDEDHRYNTLSMRSWTQTEDLADYAMGAGRPKSLRLCDEPMTKSHIPVQHQVVLDLYKRPQADGDPVWRAKLEIVASYFARGWMVQCEHLAASVVRSDVQKLGDWKGPIGLIQNTGRFIEGKRPWRDAYGWPLLLAGLGEHIPENRRYHFEQDRFFREGMHAHHCGGRLDEEWTKDIEPAPPSDTEEKPHAEEQEQPSGWRKPQWERPRPKYQEPDFDDMGFEEMPDLEDIYSGWTPGEDEYKMAA